jgi:hypothetical protein
MTDKVLTILLLAGGLYIWFRNRPVVNCQSATTIIPGGQISPVAVATVKTTTASPATTQIPCAVRQANPIIRNTVVPKIITVGRIEQPAPAPSANVSVSGAPEQIVTPITEAAYYTPCGRYQEYSAPVFNIPERSIPLENGGHCTI